MDRVLASSARYSRNVLIRFEVSNFRSIDEPVELSMVAVDRDREAARPAPMLGESLLPVAAIYGPNASGKSNVLAALAWLTSAVQHSLRLWDDGIPIEPFAFSPDPHQASVFVLELTVEGVRFEYVLELTPDRVVYEGLFHYPQRKRRRLFEREGLKLDLQRGLGSLSGTRELLTDTTLALTVARRFNEPSVREFAQHVRRIRPTGSLAALRGTRGFPRAWLVPILSNRASLRWFEAPVQEALFADQEQGAMPHSRDRALALLRLADLGIDDVEIEEHEVSFRDGTTATRPRIRLHHRVGGQRIPMEFDTESEGTKTWFSLIGPVLSALESGAVLLFDELDASLHPTLSAELLRIFHEPDTNPRGAQLIFTSHDTTLLNHLNRDEVWFTEKRDDGSTRLGALAEFAGERVRRSQNLESRYLDGRFGALPDIDQAEFLHALGLIG